MGEETKDELLRLRAENEKLRSQVKGLKECAFTASFKAAYPHIPLKILKIMFEEWEKDFDTEKFIISWQEELRGKEVGKE